MHNPELSSKNKEREKQQIRMSEKIYVLSYTAVMVGLFLLPVLLPFLIVYIDNALIVTFLFIGACITDILLGVYVGLHMNPKIFERKRAWLSRFGIPIGAQVTRLKVEYTKGENPHPVPCFELTWSHPAKKTPLSIWKRFPAETFGLTEEQIDETFGPKASLSVLCDRADPSFYLVLNPLNPSKALDNGPEVLYNLQQAIQVFTGVGKG